MEKTFKVDLHTHILPRNWPDLEKKYGYGGWVNLEHTERNTAKMMIDGKFFREIECNCYSPEVIFLVRLCLQSSGENFLNLIELDKFITGELSRLMSLLELFLSCHF